MEINWRINWSTHWPIIANKIDQSWKLLDKWAVMNNIYLPKKMSINDFINSLQKDKIYYDPSKKQWIIPTNISAIDEYWKAMVAIVWKQKEYIKELTETIEKNYNKQDKE